jgi:tRNA pseudouridine55 synthase
LTLTKPWAFLIKENIKMKLAHSGIALTSRLVSLPQTVPPSVHALTADTFHEAAFLIDKPLTWTSFDVCAKIRNSCKFINRKLKVGHAGTLDPLASGLIIVCAGRGTKACDAFQAMEKSYSGIIRIGEGTATYDAEAEVNERLPWSHITDSHVEEAIRSSFLGEIDQVPPMFSAIKVQGQKLYELAREGVEIERKTRKVTVTQFRVERDPSNPQDLHFMIDCSKG